MLVSIPDLFEPFKLCQSRVLTTYYVTKLTLLSAFYYQVYYDVVLHLQVNLAEFLTTEIIPAVITHLIQHVHSHRKGTIYTL